MLKTGIGACKGRRLKIVACRMKLDYKCNGRRQHYPRLTDCCQFDKKMREQTLFLLLPADFCSVVVLLYNRGPRSSFLIMSCVYSCPLNARRQLAWIDGPGNTRIQSRGFPDPVLTGQLKACSMYVQSCFVTTSNNSWSLEYVKRGPSALPLSNASTSRPLLSPFVSSERCSPK